MNGRLQRLERMLDLGADSDINAEALKGFSLEELERLLALVEPEENYTVEELREMLR